MVGAPDAWATSQGAGVVVAVIDTGLDAAHPDLAGRVLPEIDLLPDVTPAPEQNGHGTRVASIIAGSLNATGMAGVAPQATILPVSALDPAGYGDSSTVARGIIAAADAGARVINLSLGGPDKDPVLDQACAYAFAKGAVVVAAGGNSYLTGNQVQYPAASPNVLAVASVDRTGNPSGFSNTGPHIDIAAPGEGVLAALPGGGYDEESGTSFAAPHVAAAVALVLSANPGAQCRGGRLRRADDRRGRHQRQRSRRPARPGNRARRQCRGRGPDHCPSGLPANAQVRLQGLQRGRRARAARPGDDLHRPGPGPIPRQGLARRAGPRTGSLRVPALGSRKYRQVAVVGLRCRWAGHPAGSSSPQRQVAGTGPAAERALEHQRTDFLKVRR